MAKDTLPTLESLVQLVVERRLAENDSPARLSIRMVRQFHTEIHTRYCLPGRIEMPPKGTIKKAVRTYLETEYTKCTKFSNLLFSAFVYTKARIKFEYFLLLVYDYIQEYMDNPLKPGGKMIVSAYYERKKTDE